MVSACVRGQSVQSVKDGVRIREIPQGAPIKTTIPGNRDPALWPFAATSPWNYPIGSNAQYALITSELTTKGFGEGYFNYDHYTIPIWISANADPIVHVTRQDTVPSVTYSKHIPVAAMARSDHGISPGSDRHFDVVDPDHLHAFECYGTSWNGSAYVIPNWGSARPDTDLKGTGIGFVNPPGFTTAIAASSLGGMIRPGELATGIPHALCFITHWKMWNRHAPTGQGYVWPANSADDYWNATSGTYDGYGKTGNLFIGGLVALPRTLDLTTLNLRTSQGWVMATCLQKYGAYGRDTGDVGASIVFLMDYVAGLNGEFPTGGAFQSDLNNIAQHLQVVTNSYNLTNGGAPRAGVKLNGGDGTLLAPPAPPFDR